jgi:hypothetical protein
VSTKTPAAKPRKKAVVRLQDAVPQITPDTRRRWIAEAAYYRAEQRGFLPGRELEDWLEAEKELGDAHVSLPPPSTSRRKARGASAVSRRNV